jgi:hypothetical protein
MKVSLAGRAQSGLVLTSFRCWTGAGAVLGILNQHLERRSEFKRGKSVQRAWRKSKSKAVLPTIASLDGNGAVQVS